MVVSSRNFFERAHQRLWYILAAVDAKASVWVGHCNLSFVVLLHICQRPIKKPSTENNICQGRIVFIRGATLKFAPLVRALSEIPSYLRQLTYALTSRNTRPKRPFPAPSVVHLPACVPSGSHHPGLSVSARRTLSPRQRFCHIQLEESIFRNLYLSIDCRRFPRISLPRTGARL